MSILEKILEEIENLNYYPEGMGCGIEDRCITDRYEACEYGWHEAIEAVIEAIQNMEDGKKDNDWIPVEERLPDESSTYIVSAKEGYREIVTFVKWQNRFKKWDLSGTRAYWRVTAWQPLPEPYKPKKDITAALLRELKNTEVRDE